MAEIARLGRTGRRTVELLAALGLGLAALATVSAPVRAAPTAAAEAAGTTQEPAAEAAPSGGTAPLPIGAIAVEVETGLVLAHSEADAPRSPASLTKLMTAYVAFDALAAGEIGLDTPVVVSRAAAGQAPVKAWLEPGARAPFGELLAAAAVASANDAAYAVAEAVAGDEAAFVARMNATAARLGLRGTRFANPHGLPKDGQRTTARDMARLALALLRDHGARAGLFAERGATLRGQWLSTTNPLFGRYPGAAGMKTGFTCRAGYSLVALAERGGRRVVSVTLGAATSGARLAAATAQLDAAFAAAGPALAAWRAPHPTLAARDLTTLAGVSRGADWEAAMAAPVSEPPSVGACAPSVAGGGGYPSGWTVFLGARTQRGAAAAAITKAQKLAPGGVAYVERRRRDRMWVAMLHGFGKAQAVRSCAAYRRAGGYCLTLSPGALQTRRALWR